MLIKVEQSVRETDTPVYRLNKNPLDTGKFVRRS